MVMLESCKGCGASVFDVKSREGIYFLVCKQCGNDVAILDKEKAPQNPWGIVPSTGWGDFQVVGTGVMYSGQLTNNACVEKW